MERLCEDWGLCEICGENRELSNFCHVIVTNDNDSNAPEKRYFGLCTTCRERCRHDAKFESEVTKIVFREKLGRRIRTK